MKVLFVAEGLDLSETHMLLGLQQSGVTVQLVLPPGVPQPELLRSAGIHTFPLSLRSRMDVRTIRALRRLLQQEKYDLFHALRNNRPLANLLLAARGISIGRVCYRGTMGNLSWWDPGSRLTYLSKQLDRIVCVSDAVRHSLLHLGLEASKVTTIYKGHRPDWYQDPSDVDLSTFGIPEHAFVVGCAANMRPLKGVNVLVRSLEHLVTDRSVHLLLIGEVRDPALTKLAEHSPHQARIHFVGFRTDAQALLGKCQVSAMCSLRREGLPRAVIESMAQSVPAIVSHIGGMPELVEDGVSGYVVEPNDPSALGRRISDLANHESRREQFGAAARERINSTFSIDTTVEKMRTLYTEVMAER